MKIVEKDLKKGLVRVRLESEDDLWVLKTVVKEGDVVISSTMRDVKVDGEGKRRLPMRLAIRVKSLHFQPFSGRLRIHGVVVDGPEEYGLRGSHHTFNVDVGGEVEIVKEVWSTSELRRLERAVGRGFKALVVAMDFDEIAIAMLCNQGVNYLIDKSLPGISKAGKDPGSVEVIVDSAVDLIVKVLENVRADILIIGSPSFIKDLVADKLGRLVSVKILRDSASCGGRSGVEELLRRDNVKKLLREVNAVEAEEIFEEFMELLVKSPGRVAYGIKDVKLAAESNAVDKLLLTEDLLGDDVVEEVLDLVEGKGGVVRIVGSEFPVSSRLKGLGGMIAILRYNLNVQGLNNN